MVLLGRPRSGGAAGPLLSPVNSEQKRRIDYYKSMLLGPTNRPRLGLYPNGEALVGNCVLHTTRYIPLWGPEDAQLYTAPAAFFDAVSSSYYLSYNNTACSGKKSKKAAFFNHA
jgi:hypothetical protein